MPDNALSVFATEQTREQLERNNRGDNPWSDPKITGGVKDYFENTRSLLQDYGRLPAADYENALRRTDIRPIRHRKKNFIPFMVRLVPPDVFPTGTVRNTGSGFPTPQNAEVEVDFNRRERHAGAKVDFSKNAGFVPSTTVVGDQDGAGEQTDTASDTGEKYHLVAEAGTRDASEDASAQETYRGFRAGYRRAKRDLKNKNTRIIEGREPVIEDRNPVLEPHSGKGGEGDYDELGRDENVRYLAKQAEEMSALAPLFFYVNPESFSKSYGRVQSTARTRGKGSEPTYVVQHWGQELPSLSASGQIGAFFVDYENGAGEKTGGLAVDLRRGSFAYQHLMTIYHTYRNNGAIYNVYDLPSIVGAVQIFYDGAIYTGSFDSFSISQSEDSPFTLEYDFDFTVRFEEDMTSDPHI